VLSCLAELTAKDVLGEADSTEDKVAVLSGKLVAVNRKMDSVRKRAGEEEDVTVFLDLLADLDRQRKDLVRSLEEAKAAASSSRSADLGELTSLTALLDGADEDVRRKLRSALRRVVKEAWAVVVPRGENRLAVVRCYLAGGDERDYLLHVRRDGRWRVRSDIAIKWHRDSPAKMYLAGDLRDRTEADCVAGEWASLPDSHLEKYVFVDCPIH
jgi:hypothetical protein